MSIASRETLASKHYFPLKGKKKKNTQPRGSLQKWLLPGLSQEKYKVLEHLLCQKTRKYSKNDGDIFKEHRIQLEWAPTGLNPEYFEHQNKDNPNGITAY